MKAEEFYAWAEKCGWVKDRHGHLRKDEMRFKVQARSVRLERGYHTEASANSKSERRWVRIRSGYFSDLSINADGKLVGMK